MEKLAFSFKGKKREREFSSPALIHEFIRQAKEKFGEDFSVTLNPETVVVDEKVKER